MTEIYVVRHCEAQGNVTRSFQGVTDTDISELGEKQLSFLSDRFKNIHIDAVYSSPFKRALRTAAAVADPKGLEINKMYELHEINGGVLEGRPFAEVFAERPDIADIWDNHPEDLDPESGEKMTVAYERIYAAVREIADKNRGKSTAVFSHGGAIRCLNCRLLFGDIKRLKDTNWCENTGVSLIRFDDDLNPTLVFMNDSSHVPDEYMPKRSRLATLHGSTEAEKKV